MEKYSSEAQCKLAEIDAEPDYRAKEYPVFGPCSRELEWDAFPYKDELRRFFVRKGEKKVKVPILLGLCQHPYKSSTSFSYRR
jgi:hypothetical protein